MILMTGFHWYLGVVQASAGAAALSLSLDSTSGDLELNGPAGGSVTGSIADAVGAITATASGGAGGNSFAWTNTESADGDSVFSVSATGTTNQAAYDGLAIAMDTTGDSGGEAHEGQYRIRCTVTDSAGATATADFTLTINGNVE